jgi:uncharacterized phage protein (TIGR02220 family)
MNNGYIKLWRKIIETSFFKKPNALQLAIYLLLEANHKPYQMIYDNQELTIGRGQLTTGLFKMQEHTGLSIQNIRTSLKILVNSQFLTKKSTSKLTIITLCNYNEYQSGPTSKLTSKPTNEQQTSNKQITTIQEVKELKEVKEVKNNTIARAIIEHLNLKAGKHLNTEAPGFAKHINARVKEGATQELLKTVIEYKVWDWTVRDRGQDAKDMREYLTPDTLFNSEKFWKYADMAMSLKIKKQTRDRIRQQMTEEGKQPEAIEKELNAQTVAEIDRIKRTLIDKYGSKKYLYHMADPQEGYAHLM